MSVLGLAAQLAAQVARTFAPGTTTDVYKETTGGMGRQAFARYLNSNLFVDQESPDVSGYTFVFIEPPHLSGMSSVNPTMQSAIDEICKKSLFLAVDVTPPAISVNTEEVSTQAAISMPYATTKVATGTLAISFLDNSNMDINSLHNVWVEYIYNQLWGDLEPSAEYLDPGDPLFGALDYATSAYVVKYDPSLTDPPVMVGKATGIFPTGVPVKEPLGSRTNRELVMQTVSYTCSYYEMVHPRSKVQVYASSNSSTPTILDEVIEIANKFKV